MNRLLFDPYEIDDNFEAASGGDDKAMASITLLRGDYRTVHVAKIMGLQNGKSVRAGIVRSPSSPSEGSKGNCGHRVSALAGLITDEATVEWLPEGKNVQPQPTKNGEPLGSLRISIPPPPKSRLWSDGASGEGEVTAPPSVSLLLALPRPLQLSRILPMVAQLGVDKLVLTAARKVGKYHPQPQYSSTVSSFY